MIAIARWSFSVSAPESCLLCLEYCQPEQTDNATILTKDDNELIHKTPTLLCETFMCGILGFDRLAPFPMCKRYSIFTVSKGKH